MGVLVVEAQENDEGHDDAVEGIILLRRGENPDDVLKDIHKKVDSLNNAMAAKSPTPFMPKRESEIRSSGQLSCTMWASATRPA